MVREEKIKSLQDKPNRLIHEKSPYLLQHAYNPVDWYPWGEEAFEKARRENKPIFLSIGYSTCHWCHVMEKESFEDPEVASLMNRAFIAIKVDREERPDLDNIYMTACQMMTGSGGWPLTIVMTPDKKPFFAATYIPKVSRFGRAGMMDLIPRIEEIWVSRRNEVFESAEKIISALKNIEKGRPGDDLDLDVLKQAYRELEERYDLEYGGFSVAPKFPSPHNLLFLLRYWKRTGDGKALDMVEKTLLEMQKGGVYDHVGYGFHRYATDREWLVPHFEKMLYDQAMLAFAYLETYQATGKEIYKRIVKEIFEYVLRDMKAPEGGFYSAEDADSEGVEGKFYIWKEDELIDVLGEDEAQLISKVFNVSADGNFKEEATGKKEGGNILHLKKLIPEIAAEMNMSEHEIEKRVIDAKRILFNAREKRIHPHKDDKILTDWNGLMIATLARGGQVLSEPEYTEAARTAADFILRDMRRPDGRFYHRYREGEAGIDAHLDDYVFLVWGLIELYEATFDARYLKTARQVNQDAIRHFWDDQAGGFYFTADDSEQLIVRKKEINDGAIPSGNSVGMLNLLRLSRFFGDPELEETATGIGRAFSETVKQFPSGYTQLMVSADFGEGPSYEVVIAGDPQAEDTKAMLKALRSRFIPNKVIILRPTNGKSAVIDSLAEFVKYHVSLDGKATAYVCLNQTCKAPTTEIDEMLEMIK
ncbi:thioredoxin domain-containing protein [Thermodesulfobacteriota bacterium]